MRMKGRDLFAVVLFVAIVGGLSFGELIWSRPTAVVNNLVDTGVVSVSIKQSERDLRGGEKDSEGEIQTILPGMEISQLCRIENGGDDCYIRVKTEISGTGQLSDDCLSGIDESWIKAEDGYFYYLDILQSGQSVVFCEGISIPVDFSAADSDEKINVRFEVEAIQSHNFVPEWGTVSPWGDVEVLEAKDEENMSMKTVKSSLDRKFIVEYRGEAYKLIVNEENFFGNLPRLMPGDEFTDGAKLVNNGNHPVKLFFRCMVNDDTDITDKIQLIIETEVCGESEVIYEGPLRAKTLSEDILLMTIPAQSSGKMVFSIRVPAGMNNEYALQNKAVQWIFSTEEIITQVEEGVETGDQRHLGGYMILAGLSLGFAVRMIQRKRGLNGDRSRQ